ncbi:TPA: MBL fold metallo-hydrolase [Bacillus thuringiensis]|nr:MBL fold metallo-hydrolase [Bacillus thuringiensis]
MENAILKHGYEIKNLKNIIITHYDDDHIGPLYDFKVKYPQINVIASEIESNYISGDIKSERLVQAEEMLERMPNEEKEFGKWFIQQLKNIKHISVDEKVHDGQMILNNECQIVATPGHTSGHISLYFPNLDCVITGDAAVQENRGLVIANPNFCLDIEKAKQSLNRIKSFKATQYYCYHGGKLTV